MGAGGSGRGKGRDPGSGATIQQLEEYLLELKQVSDPRGESAFVREEVTRRIAALKHHDLLVGSRGA